MVIKCEGNRRMHDLQKDVGVGCLSETILDDRVKANSMIQAPGTIELPEHIGCGRGVVELGMG